MRAHLVEDLEEVRQLRRWAPLKPHALAVLALAQTPLNLADLAIEAEWRPVFRARGNEEDGDGLRRLGPEVLVQPGLDLARLRSQMG